MSGKWSYISVGFESDPVYVGGVNVWDYEWLPSGKRSVKLPHPTYPNQIHRFEIYCIEVDFNEFKGVRFEFAASELSNGVWGFYLEE